MNALFLVFLLGVMSGNTPFSAGSLPVSDNLIAQQVAKTIPGVYSNEPSLAKTKIPDELAHSPKFQPQDIIVFPIFENRQDKHGLWFYFGCYSPHFKDKPLDEAIFKVYVVENIVKVDMFNVPKDQGFSMEWTKSQPFDILNADLLSEYKSTTLDVSLLENNGVILYSPKDQPFQRMDVKANYAYINFEMHFYKDYMLSNSTFLDKDKNKVDMNPLDLRMVKTKTDGKKF